VIVDVDVDVIVVDTVDVDVHVHVHSNVDVGDLALTSSSELVLQGSVSIRWRPGEE
jgi:hypothetical protein